MNYKSWVESVPSTIKSDSAWNMRAYQLALFVATIGWRDVTRLAMDKRMVGLSDQLYRSLGSIGANIIEGYSRGTGKDRARFYEYALGSAREARDWYYKSEPVLGVEVTGHRMGLLSQIIRLLLTMVPNQRTRTVKEEHSVYQVDLPEGDITDQAEEALTSLLKAIPWA